MTWLTSFVPATQMDRRLETARNNLFSAHREWQHGKRPPKYDHRDSIAYQILQARNFASDRLSLVPDDISLIAPIFQTVGKNLNLLRSIPGADERASRLMNQERAQPDAGLYELLVALAYRLRNWPTVQFVPEAKGGGKTPDLIVSRPRSKWAIECKRMRLPQYVDEEQMHAERLFAPVHAANGTADRSSVMTVRFEVELKDLPEDYMIEKLEQFAPSGLGMWSDDFSTGVVQPMDWRLCREVMEVDDIYFGASRMIELLVGGYDHELEYSVSGKWTPARNRPLYAQWLHQATVIRWTNRSFAANRAKAKHFKSVVANAEKQLPSDMPSVVHVGTESRSGLRIDALRNLMNKVELIGFEPKSSRLRYVYNNVLAPEATTDPDEVWAIQETTVPYRVGRHSTNQPLPYHLLLRPSEGDKDVVPWAQHILWHSP